MNSRVYSSCISGPMTMPPSSHARCGQHWTKWPTSRADCEGFGAPPGRLERSFRFLLETLVMDGAMNKGGSLSELLVYFLRLGSIGFGGPVALVAQMERELVAERGWLTSEQMREAIAICQSLPGPLAIQVGIYAAYLRGGFWGAWIGGWAFIFPNFVIVAALAALYVYLGDLKPVTAIFYGVSPAVIALILHSCYRLAKLGMEDWLQWAIAFACFMVTIILQAEVALLFIAAGIGGVLYYGNLFRKAPRVKLQIAAVPLIMSPTTAATSTIGKLLLFF